MKSENSYRRLSRPTTQRACNKYRMKKKDEKEKRERMEQQTYEREIDLVQLIKTMLKKIWIMIAAGVVGAILLGTYKILPMVQNLNNPETLEQQEKDYQNSLEEFEKNKKRIEKEIDNLNKSIERQEEYNEKSVLMQMNPFDVQVGTVQYYIDTDYQIILESTYQNPDITRSVLNAYASMATNGTMFNYLQDNMKEKLELRYLQELIKVEVDYNNYMINIRVIHKGEKECEELLDLIKRCFSKYQATVVKNIGPHDMQEVTESFYSTVELSYETTQTSNEDKVTSFMESLEAKTKEFEEMKEPEKAAGSVTAVLKSGIKYILMGGLLGGFIAAAVIFFVIIMDTTVKDEKDVAFYLDLPVLASVPVIQGEEKTVKAGRRNKKARLSQYAGNGRK